VEDGFHAAPLRALACTGKYRERDGPSIAVQAKREV
jgi:hypothetical protein